MEVVVVLAQFDLIIPQTIHKVGPVVFVAWGRLIWLYLGVEQCWCWLLYWLQRPSPSAPICWAQQTNSGDCRISSDWLYCWELPTDDGTWYHTIDRLPPSVSQSVNLLSIELYSHSPMLLLGCLLHSAWQCRSLVTLGCNRKPRLECRVLISHSSFPPS